MTTMNPNQAVYIAALGGMDLSKVKKSYTFFPNANQLYLGKENVFNAPYSHSLWVGIVWALVGTIDVFMGHLLLLTKSLFATVFHPLRFLIQSVRAGLRGTATGVVIAPEDFQAAGWDRLHEIVQERAKEQGLTVGDIPQANVDVSPTLH